jgi:asparagine synthetase B (glutamine-hydrolysing)
MAHSIEGRFPYLNRSVFELALQIPTQCQVGGKYGQEKLLLRKAFKDLLPEAIQKRPKAPLPSPAHIGFHKVLCGALQRAIQETPSSIWSILDKTNINDMIGEFERAVASLYSSGKIEKGGEELTRYIYLSEPLQIRTPQMFGLLTLLRWWTINF